jgi:hypothetical protein
MAAGWRLAGPMAASKLSAAGMVYAARRTMRIKVGDGLHGPCPKPKGQDKQVALAQQRPKTENDNQNEQIFEGSANPDARLPSLTRHLPS